MTEPHPSSRARSGPSRILALDYGRRRIGAAISDPRLILASPLEVYERREPSRDFEHYRQLVREERIERIVVGLPVHTGGGESELSIEARAWGLNLAEACGCRVLFHDERFTSQDADALLRAAGLSPRAHRAKRDMLAAQILLQHYLDAGCPEEEKAPEPIDDPKYP
jgi:putative Holliday junction resolvase